MFYTNYYGCCRETIQSKNLMDISLATTSNEYHSKLNFARN